MSERYNEKNTNEKEQEGRDAYMNGWLANKAECEHLCFTAERWCKFDCIFLSGSTTVVCDIKSRTYHSNFLLKYGVEIDAEKARDVCRIAKKMKALPVIITCTSDGKFIVSDLSRATKEDLFKDTRQNNNNNNHEQELKELINLKNCTIQ